jgi:hypothetical protein
MQNRALAAWATGLGLVFASQAWAQSQGGAPATVSGTSRAATVPCPDKAASGGSALSYDCLNQRLAPTPSAPPGSSGANPAEGLVTAPPNRVGIVRGFQ